MIKIYVQDKKLQDMLSAVETTARALGGGRGAKAIYTQLGEFGHKDVQDNFKRQGATYRWQELAFSTQVQRAKQGYNPQRPILIRSGKRGGLLGSIHSKAYSDRAEVASNKVYDAVLHHGAKAGSLWKGTYTVPAHRVKSHKRKTRSGKTTAVKAHMRKAYTRKGQAPWGDIPARPFMEIGKRFYQRAEQFLSRYIVQGRK